MKELFLVQWEQQSMGRKWGMESISAALLGIYLAVEKGREMAFSREKWIECHELVRVMGISFSTGKGWESCLG